jgi:hypothetical protein
VLERLLQLLHLAPRALGPGWREKPLEVGDRLEIGGSPPRRGGCGVGGAGGF